jgi:hypothetical protein
MAGTTQDQSPESADAQSRADEGMSGIAVQPMEREGDLNTLLDALATILARLARTGRARHSRMVRSYRKGSLGAAMLVAIYIRVSDKSQVDGYSWTTSCVHVRNTLLRMAGLWCRSTPTRRGAHIGTSIARSLRPCSRPRGKASSRR